MDSYQRMVHNALYYLCIGASVRVQPAQCEAMSHGQRLMAHEFYCYAIFQRLGAICVHKNDVIMLAQEMHQPKTQNQKRVWQCICQAEKDKTRWFYLVFIHTRCRH